MKTYQVRGYMHNRGEEFQETFGEVGEETRLPTKDEKGIKYIMPKQILLEFLQGHKCGYTIYVDSLNTYKLSFTIDYIAKEYDKC